jgi:hypothetical protein
MNERIRGGSKSCKTVSVSLGMLSLSLVCTIRIGFAGLRVKLEGLLERGFSIGPKLKGYFQGKTDSFVGITRIFPSGLTELHIKYN